jgi:arsenate reductase
MKTVIFACVHNAGRSQMAGAFFNHFADPGRAPALSAGTQPAEHVHPEVVAVMRTDGKQMAARSDHAAIRSRARSEEALLTERSGRAGRRDRHA